MSPAAQTLSLQIHLFIIGPIVIAWCAYVWHVGVPWTKTIRITGFWGKVIASIGIAIGATMILFAAALFLPAVKHAAGADQPAKVNSAQQ
jgi:hypothetical protein